MLEVEEPGETTVPQVSSIVYAPCFSDDKLFVLHTSGNVLRERNRLGGHAACLTVSLDGYGLYYVTDLRELNIFR